ncbi:hypothetical protein AVEN_249976-1 [Araneus ventricosus]|uniref:Integrase catalytic domain-containing protein n=1 Tax=Araneus ventricosus TaxID=182803 RepID=A0A4Y2HF44_ARAVE|nr:hypothetical protein AVEN_249976-1 [Araneus ventricosus]
MLAPEACPPRIFRLLPMVGGPYLVSSPEAEWPKQPVLKDSDQYVLKEEKSFAFRISDLTSEAFIAALKRFCSRRGTLKDIHSDNGTTFIGAKKKPRDLFKFISKINLDENVRFFLSHMKIEWHIIPPLSPHLEDSRKLE